MYAQDYCRRCQQNKVLWLLTIHATVTLSAIVLGPVNTVGIKGGSISLVCEYDDVKPSKYWTKTPISGTAIVVSNVTVPNSIIKTIGSSYFLNISNLALSDEGTYSCSIGSQIMGASVSVEVPPVLQLIPPDSRLSLTENEMSILTCKAIGAIPAVNITWLIDNETVNTSLVTTMVEDTSGGDPGTQDTVSSFQYLPDRGDKEIKCRSSGQTKAKPPSPVSANLNILYAPTCDISVKVHALNTAFVKCSCDGNPPLEESDYQIFKNDILVHTGKEVKVTTEKTVNFHCAGENIISTATSPLQTFKGSPVVPNDNNNSAVATVLIMMGILGTLILVAIILTVIILKKRGSPNKDVELTNASENTKKEEEALNEPLVNQNDKTEAVKEEALNEPLVNQNDKTEAVKEEALNEPLVNQNNKTEAVKEEAVNLLKKSQTEGDEPVETETEEIKNETASEPVEKDVQILAEQNKAQVRLIQRETDKLKQTKNGDDDDL